MHVKSNSWKWRVGTRKWWWSPEKNQEKNKVLGKKQMKQIDYIQRKEKTILWHHCEWMLHRMEHSSMTQTTHSSHSQFRLVTSSRAGGCAWDKADSREVQNLRYEIIWPKCHRGRTLNLFPQINTLLCIPRIKMTYPPYIHSLQQVWVQ